MEIKDLLLKLKSGELYVYLAVKEYPMSHAKELSKKINMCTRVVRDYLTSLAELGYLDVFVVTERYGKVRRFKIKGP